MVTAADFRLVYCHAAIYSPRFNFSATKVLSHFTANYQAQLGGEAVVLPIPTDSPPEIPRIVFQDNDGRLKVQAALTRLDVMQEGDGLTADAFGEFLKFSTTVFTGYMESMKCQVNRLAVVVRRFVDNKKAAEMLARHFCKDQWLADPLDRPSDFELHAAKQFQFGGWLQISSWFRCRSVKIKFGEGAFMPGVMVEQDFNSPVHEEGQPPLAAADVRKFFQEAPEELDLVVRRYFPPEVNNA